MVAVIEFFMYFSSITSFLKHHTNYFCAEKTKSDGTPLSFSVNTKYKYSVRLSRPSLVGSAVAY